MELIRPRPDAYYFPIPRHLASPDLLFVGLREKGRGRLVGRAPTSRIELQMDARRAIESPKVDDGSWATPSEGAGRGRLRRVETFVAPGIGRIEAGGGAPRPHTG